MKHILYLACIALPLVCGADIAMAFTSGVPPHSGPGSVFYGRSCHPETKSRQRGPKEVNDTFEAPLTFLMAPQNYRREKAEWNGLTTTARSGV
jgi:hypothetical protein